MDNHPLSSTFILHWTPDERDATHFKLLALQHESTSAINATYM